MKTINNIIKVVTIFGLLTINYGLNAQVKFQKHFSAGTTLDESAHAIKVLPNGNYLVAGYSYHASGGSGDLTVMEVDVLGNKVREIAYGNSSQENASDIVLTDNDYFVLYGLTTGALGDYDIQMVAIDNDFSGALGNKVLGTTAREVPRKFVKTHDGGYAGVSWSNTPNWQHYVVKSKCQWLCGLGQKMGQQRNRKRRNHSYD
jgi:hypothetical protein